MNATDLTGKPHIRGMAISAKNGGGLVCYFTRKPILRNNTTELKEIYILDVDGTWVHRCGRLYCPLVLSRFPLRRYHQHEWCAGRVICTTNCAG